MNPPYGLFIMGADYNSNWRQIPKNIQPQARLKGWIFCKEFGSGGRIWAYDLRVMSQSWLLVPTTILIYIQVNQQFICANMRLIVTAGVRGCDGNVASIFYQGKNVVCPVYCSSSIESDLIDFTGINSPRLGLLWSTDLSGTAVSLTPSIWVACHH